MLGTSRKNVSKILSVNVSVKRLETGIPSLNEIKKPEDDYHPSNYTIWGNKRKDPMHYTDRKVGRGYWHFSNTIYQSRPKIHPKLAKGLKRNFYIIFALSLGLCLDYDWLGYHIKRMATNFRPEAADYNPYNSNASLS
ncbi:unnamed protein product [Litomosoides sigmodontis]|uniref:Uncharacterized protein n=1 Tax=Litomosoides sigmodontis TaxID=42156 RepID=A0A3P6UGB5_LITSI|nr:unnamed protein product [Litomosoides sigmodontis]